MVSTCALLPSAHIPSAALSLNNQQVSEHSILVDVPATALNKLDEL